MEETNFDWSALNVQPAQNMSDRLFNRISQMIMSGKLPEGYVFPNEAVLCEQMHVGRSTIREAYKALELSGYVTRSKRGTFVNSKLDILSATPMKEAFAAASTSDVNEFREMMEVKCAALAAQKATPADIENLRAISERIQALYELGDMPQVAAGDAEFHRQISKLSGNKLIASTMLIMTLAWDEGVRRNFLHAAENNRQIFRDMHGQHEAIITAIEDHDREAAEAAMKTHIRFVTAPE